ncbi:hypothetical protein LRP31_31060 [Mesorhizobium mediterraneum]|uniref:hypothetical protein n=1 Tax=Mesorhizobium TaxID=68287 RepID=UPI001FE09671|nr:MULTISPECIES: hypothetical protein [Mesorhizobium]WIW53414.1 hypothetical protein LRP31_31060 [Mesorhizobium mediterraneum]
MAPLDAQSCAMSMSVKRNEADLVDNEKAATGGAALTEVSEDTVIADCTPSPGSTIRH